MFTIPSPCIGVCQVGSNGNCLGCFRTRDERLYWMQVGPDVQRKIIKACAMRKRRAQAKGKQGETSKGDSDARQTDLPF